MMRRFLAIVVIAMATLNCAASQDALSWPAATREARPWARWWWLGSAVDDANLTRLLQMYHEAGLGGVEICPIYGAKGSEDRYLEFLSPKWVAALKHTINEADRLGMGVDLTTGTGWPFGGPNIAPADASMRFSLQDHPIATSAPIQKVKHAAPGGEGNVLDPYSPLAMEHYLQRFTDALKDLDIKPRAHFHDSFEYYGANWTADFFEQFRRLRGYDLREHLAALAGEGDTDTVARVKHDYRETIADLHLEYLETWSDWAHKQHGLSRNQAHGSPTNLLDAYAIADIPETEIFGRPDESHRVMLMFASSAAHVTGRNLASSESFTWLGEHFQTTLADCKAPAELLFTSGINHIFLHGVAYSPQDILWPGWLFYASTDFAPDAGLWHDLPAMLAYITRVQSVLQEGQSDNDLLLYFPVHDFWQDADGMLKPLTVHDQKQWLYRSAFYDSASKLLDQGCTLDFVSDRLLEKARVGTGGHIILGDHEYRALVIPPTRYMLASTAKKLQALAHKGAVVVVQHPLPDDVPGLKYLTANREVLKEILKDLHPGEPGEFRRERLVDYGLKFMRRKRDTGWNYFLTNPTDHEIDTWIPLATPAVSALLMDPMFEKKVGRSALRKREGQSEVYLQLAPGGSIVVRTFEKQGVEAPAWKYFKPAGTSALPVGGTWSVTFIEGGPALPKSFMTNMLASWTRQEDAEAKRFAGTARYSIDFDVSARKDSEFILDLGKVCESARVKLNGQELGTLWCPPFTLPVQMREGKNHLEVEVTNLAANRIADLDRRGVQWKSFHEINFVNKDYKPFDASHWALRDSGLIGPVQLIPIEPLDIK